jgi:hypothetical protein
MTKLANKYVLAVAVAAVALAAPQVASAQDGKKEAGASASGSLSLGGASAEAHGAAEGEKKGEEKKGEGEKKEGEKGEHAEHGEGEHGEEGEEAKFHVGVDLVFGFGKTNTVTAVLPGQLATVPEATVSASKITTQSFLLSGGYELGKGFGVGFRVPLTLGQWQAPGQSSHSTSAIGNVELEAEYEMHLNPQMKLFFGLGLALPTAQGDEVPNQEELDADKNAALQNQNGYDRFAVNHAAAASRGYMDNALFEPKRFGIIPMVGLDYTVSHILIDPFVKMENLISTSGNPEHKYIGELVLGSFLGYEVAKQLDVGARVWANVLFAGESGGVGVVEPQLRMHFGNIHPLVGGIIPFAGSALTSPQFGGVRVAVVARF